MKGTVSGIFRREEDAERALQRLVDHHFDPDEHISLLARHDGQVDEVPVHLVTEVGRDAAVGGALGAAFGMIGGTLVAVGLFGTPGVGLFAAGPIVAALQGGVAMGELGVVTGALAGLGAWHEEPDFDAHHIHEGGIWMGVHVEGERAAETARTVLRECRAQYVRG